ncbi:SDR family oxidoreductase [Cryobacterium arcticum]|uniref:Oxidoreductase n=1 Tax=Cryobacterium arcticum TaxID=670052 RepID=A0A1B1BGR6_9MICO|nr:SDR family oxidoreductase [Cryobacterium arcticum]ANP71769.1 oxidoreductase [Cryobacterium arcticum]
MNGITDKVVAITGASSGIGEATARLLAERGAMVALGARRTGRLDDIVATIVATGGRAIACEVDVTSPSAVANFVDQTVRSFGRLDVFIGNAGVSSLSPMAELDVDGWSSMIDVNLHGVLNGIAAALPVFQTQGRGHFVTTVSTSGIKIVPTQAVYAATKNAVRTLLEGLRQESTDGVMRTTSISPGYVQTELVDSIADPRIREQAKTSMAALGIPAEAVARAIAFAIEQPDDVEIGDLTIRPTRQG